jgi:excisionase family DNA binding protein
MTVPMQLNDLPMLATPKQAATVMGLTDSQVRALIREGRIAYVLIGKRSMVPRDAIDRFVQENTVQPCHVEIQVPASGILKNGDVTTSCGLTTVAAGSAARARQIADKLKLRLPSSSTNESAAQARVIPLKP